jgi:hypothetical protein
MLSSNPKRPGLLRAACLWDRVFARICFVYGVVVLISIFRGNAIAATGAVISKTPLIVSV